MILFKICLAILIAFILARWVIKDMSYIARGGPSADAEYFRRELGWGKIAIFYEKALPPLIGITIYVSLNWIFALVCIIAKHAMTLA
ncbi:hypothetical protein [Sphingobium yanoikuyae]|uniref:hypothetical protein n=1 Tax=Sphingobium yanoikuyae TaxID=13690 RepID=UPI00243172AE|nr:hypothetical protein [Sphingobium yanoikuyae]